MVSTTSTALQSPSWHVASLQTVNAAELASATDLLKMETRQQDK
jgi:hypothetical protein